MTDTQENESRDEALTDGFIGEGTVKIGGHALRPFTFGSFTLCRKLKLSLFTKEGAADGMDEAETMRQLAAFFWIQSQPVKTVLDAVRDGSAPEKIDAFEFDIPIHDLPAIMRRISELTRLASAAAVEIAEKPSSSEGDQPPGN